VSVTAALGFVAAGCHAGIKRRRHDMALIATEDGRPVPAAAVFTRNAFVAPPVVASRSRLAANGGQASAIIVNSGNANAGTGEAGARDAEAMCAAAAAALGAAAGDVLVCSTGIIGTPLPIGRILEATPKLAKKLARDGGDDAARGILTTDRRPKQAAIERPGFTLGGMAKGCGMLAPNMATMLAFLTTDAALEPGEMGAMLKDSVDRSFNTLNVDGATSTNDSVILLASGRRGAPDKAAFADALHRLCEDLTLQMARDAEGMTRLVRLTVTGAASDSEARLAAKAIAENNLVKCSWHGGDAYWGRILAAAGACGAAINVAESRIIYGGTTVSRGGEPHQHDRERVKKCLREAEISIGIHLGIGTGTARIVTVDLGPGYIRENSRTS
jgi:glutamate N-acetyltransferase/amino-acid N-acetyltransferase